MEWVQDLIDAEVDGPAQPGTDLRQQLLAAIVELFDEHPSPM
jgi:hypothetical protein